MNVLIVESPSKAKSINKYLGSNFKVLASVGHVRDLSAKNDAIDTENDFQMKWETSDRGKKVIKEITDAAKKGFGVIPTQKQFLIGVIYYWIRKNIPDIIDDISQIEEIMEHKSLKK